MKPETSAVHAGYVADDVSRSASVPVYQTVAYEFDSAQHAADLFDEKVEGNIYGRMMNPTTAVLEKRMAELEGGTAAMAVSSGAAAITYAILNITQAGDHIVALPNLYGATYTLLNGILGNFNISVTFAASDSASDIEKVIKNNTKAIYCESIGNPAGNVVDIETVSALAHQYGIPLIVDNTVASPALIRPISHGADIVIHSMTKYIGGHGSFLGGIIIDSGKFPWREHKSRYPMLNEPEPTFHDVRYCEQYGEKAYIARCRTVMLRNMGATLPPQSAIHFLYGLETLFLRMNRHCENALSAALHLEQHPCVDWVSYCGLPESDHHAMSLKYMSGRGGGILTFGIHGGKCAAETFYDSLRLIKRLVNIGDTKSLACHPASTTHRNVPDSEQIKLGVLPEMIRLCIGIEHIDDILGDIDQALLKSQR
ncbi:O-acetylhomoserine aminocarboxypropyltransferase/cysteine synthase family protein [Pantoea stewartii subsp. indologenes]|uniref:O-acetylhomoserine aminocarboxypropyltransferase/cysteine synthase family protein n=1 Tax=Pantoea stewartii TaxID=66269 RepID=UPI003FA46B83